MKHKSSRTTEMERKNTQVIITLAVVIAMLCVSCAAERELIAVGQCISICVSRCSGSANYNRCYNGCARGCVPALTAASTPSSYYCNLGCSLHKCGNISDGLFFFLFFPCFWFLERLKFDKLICDMNIFLVVFMYTDWFGNPCRCESVGKLLGWLL